MRWNRIIMADHYADCEAPCQTACPAESISSLTFITSRKPFGTKAIEVIKKIPLMPLSIGRVCPAFVNGVWRNQMMALLLSASPLRRPS